MVGGFAFLSEGKIHLKVGELPVRTFESSFARDIRERTLRLQQRSAWKTHGSGAQFMSGSLLWGAQDREPEPMRIAITGLSRGMHRASRFTRYKQTKSQAFLLLKTRG